MPPISSDPTTPPIIAERQRLLDDQNRTANWKRWGPYLADRQWGTVREDYSADGNVWNYLTHDQSRSRAYRWGEDGLLGICDREGRLHFALSLWNGKDPILKERLFGLTGPEGNHGEDVKELYYYLDCSPTHSYMKALYKYPQAAFPYTQLVDENARRGRMDREFEVTDTGVFENSRYFDVIAEYAKASHDDILIRITITNRGPEAAACHVLPTLWFKNSWSWGCNTEGCEPKPWMQRDGSTGVQTKHQTLGAFRMDFAPLPNQPPPQLLFTDNETNAQRLFGKPSAAKHLKDAMHDFVIDGKTEAVNPDGTGTKMSALYELRLAPGASATIRARLRPDSDTPSPAFGNDFDSTFDQRQRDCDEFYASLLPKELTEGECQISRQAYAGLLWTKQFFNYVVAEWLDGDPSQPAPPPQRREGRNKDWRHLFSRDVLSMPDGWEYPWFAMWDLAFHTVCFARLDPLFAKDQLTLLLREWYMHPNGQL
ncbi:MAG: glucosidase, partial [Phycisphaerae bacterium]|nr:glucosidase [Phycisphaerae bacterium]